MSSGPIHGHGDVVVREESVEDFEFEVAFHALARVGFEFDVHVRIQARFLFRL